MDNQTRNEPKDNALEMVQDDDAVKDENGTKEPDREIQKIESGEMAGMEKLKDAEISEKNEGQTEENAPERQPRKAYLLALCSSVALGFANFFGLLLAKRKDGAIGIFTPWPALLFQTLIYNLIKIILWFKTKRNKKQNNDEQNIGYFSKVNSMYYIKDETGNLVLASDRVRSTLLIMIINISIEFLILQTFTFVAKSGVNAGVMSIIFSSSIIYTSIIFYFKEGQKLTKWDVLGSFLIIVCVALIGIGGIRPEEEQQDTAKVEDATHYLMLSIIGCLFIGFFFSLMSIAMSFVVRSGSSVVQANYDSDLINCFIYLPVYLILMIRDSSTYDLTDLVIGSLIRLCVTTGLIFYGQAFRYGKAGPIQTIDNQKSTWTTIIIGVVFKQWPNILQIIGMIMGFIGLAVFILGKEESGSTDQKKDENEGKIDEKHQKKLNNEN